MCFSIYDTLLRFFALITKEIIINFVMTNKMFWNERMSTIKHVDII